MTNYSLRNQTPHELVLLGGGQLLKLAPLQQTRTGGDPAEVLGAAAAAAKRDNTVAWEREPVRSARLLAAAWLIGGGVVAAAAGTATDLLVGTRTFRWFGAVFAAACIISGLSIVLRGSVGRRSASATAPQLEPSPIRGDVWGQWRDLLVATSQGVVVAILVLVAVSAPALAIYYGTELSDVIVFTTWRHPALVAGPDAQYIVVARLLQLVLLIIVSVVPALMYFQFDRERLSTLVNRWLHAIFRLDPSVETVADVDAKYGRRVEEFYGASLGTGVGAPRKRLRDRSPVIIATLVIAIGWIVVLLNSNGPATNSDPAEPLPSLQDLFRPTPTPMTLGFLGAYFLSVQVALRGYVRGDLKPKTYNVITVRILMAVILAWALEALWGPSKAVLALSFLAALVPNTVLRRIRELTGRARIGGDDLQVKSPLSKLDDIDVYERTRLEEEGITSIQALARHDLVDLTLSSRIPVPRLVDWVDQAILYQHVPDSVDRLRTLGIRTATDYLQVYDDADSRQELVAAMGTQGVPVPAPLLRAALDQDEWLSYVRNWREHDGTERPAVRVYDTRGRVRRTAGEAPPTASAVPPPPVAAGAPPGSQSPAGPVSGPSARARPARRPAGGAAQDRTNSPRHRQSRAAGPPTPSSEVPVPDVADGARSPGDG